LAHGVNFLIYNELFAIKKSIVLCDIAWICSYSGKKKNFD
jgi:uncharacterized membrane protein